MGYGETFTPEQLRSGMMDENSSVRALFISTKKSYDSNLEAPNIYLKNTIRISQFKYQIYE